ncbi:MAG: chemotaxis response regulator protein-glutamate methylesterase [Phycisphaerae bacterium]|nr:chemotaxis response regulator protein-glutamate methylesterase [Phycisphaerae bacterium]
MSAPVRVIIVDDSAITRQVIARELARNGDIEVVATAADPLSARDEILAKRPDVLILDLEMPRMDGLTFLRRVNKYSPMPVIICSSQTGTGTAKSIECLEAGAFDVVCKPSTGMQSGPFSEQLRELVRAAARAKRPAAATPSLATPARPAARPSGPRTDARRVIAIGSSTGGTEALRTILTALPADMPGIVIAQHMPEGFTRPFADRLNGLTQIEVREAADGDVVTNGLALVARGGRHLKVVREGGRLVARVTDGPHVKRHRPSVEVLFESVAQTVGRDAMAVMLTGMGDDGCDGMLSMRRAGAYTVAQDEASSVVFGMPKRAIEVGAAMDIAPLDAIAARMRDFATKVRAAA